jgi:hypothetical protein
MEIVPKCHPGNPVWAGYWDGMLYFKCSICEKPIIKIPVSRNLLTESVK